VKAVVCTRYGPPEVLRVEDVPVPVPRGNEVRIRVVAAAVTSSDCYVRGLNLPVHYRAAARLALGLTRPRRPILGMVLAGEVESVGAAVTVFGPGEQVFGFDRRVFGAYAEYVCWPQDTVLAAMPDGLTHQEGDLVLLKELAEKKAIRPVIDRCYGLEQMAEAHRYVDGGHKKGNVIVTVSP
jgi:NADPH:quinone reductase-like Zn-dependent oxidoreductase